MKTAQGKRWRNWSKTCECTPEKILYPSSIEEVVSFVKEAVKQKKKIRVVGAGHSFTDLVKTDNWLVSLDLLSGIEQLDEAASTVTVLGGTRLFQLGEGLGQEGYSQENLGDINVQSIAGAISTGTHGTGLEFGNIPTQVVELVIVTASGEVLTVSEEQNPQYFKACLLSLGVLGIIVKVTLKIIRTPIYEYRSEKIEYPLFVQQLEYFINENRHFEFYLFPYSDLVQVKTMNITTHKPQRLLFHNLKNLILENYLFFVLSEVCRLFPKSSPTISRLSAMAVGTTTITAKSHEIFATPRLVKFREIEYCIPLHYFKSAIQEIRECIELKKHKVHFPIECRTVKADDIWFSPSYQRDSAYIAFHMYKGMPYEEYFREVEAIMQKYGGRPHWGKMHSLGKKELHACYPKLPDFLAIRHELDPQEIFLNDYIKKILIG
ncbi:FAD-binding protein [Peribacillus psychrosaccharolyticus]|uniref:FAD-binding protein n=1 Tax=Peribacillus psychrosaccharolyticus TaxID=1407 RepID=A0A974NRB8_PERPY|nr:D-arabinono-1,4-lactone oxidase [Peribacillus psychrosaccharolyticus]MEC2057123.1 D-arabinono-1,4-lactone oxidase [Peribacillus psychrosaccharolyticus]MED3745045.1 D-arabinono-1,4-lactone oxidase [Peribacillus psychrosaccharolyticus]QQT02630.1 FAD-binding protein [Peribacillus psychrosaccharolyticus]